MFSVCANPDCQKPFDCEEGRLFRFHKDFSAGGEPPNIHSVQHFWLCGACAHGYTLEYQNSRGVLITTLRETVVTNESTRCIAAA